MKKEIITANAPGAIGPYSQAVAAGDTIYASGALGINMESGLMESDVCGQTEWALRNLESILKTAGGSMEQIVKTTVFVKSMADFAKVNEVYAKHFSSPYPARSCVEVAALPKGALVEIEAVCVLNQ